MNFFIKSMFSEGEVISSMRVMSFFSLGFGGIIALYGMYKNMNLTEVSMLAGVFVGSAFGGKVAQKMQEIKITPPKNPYPESKE